MHTHTHTHTCMLSGRDRQATRDRHTETEGWVNRHTGGDRVGEKDKQTETQRKRERLRRIARFKFDKKCDRLKAEK